MFFNKRYEETMHPERLGATHPSEPSGPLKNLKLGEGDGQMEEQKLDSTNQETSEKSDQASNGNADKNGNTNESSKLDVEGQNTDLTVQTEPQETADRKESPKSEL